MSYRKMKPFVVILDIIDICSVEIEVCSWEPDQFFTQKQGLRIIAIREINKQLLVEKSIPVVLLCIN